MITMCSGDHLVSATSDGSGCTATPTRHFGGKYLKAEMYGKRFKNSDEAFAAMHAHGYGVEFYPRTSVPMPLFEKLPHVQRQCRFDALYRYWKHLKRGGQHALAIYVEAKLKRLAKSVGIFHRCTKQFNQPKEKGKQ